MNHRTILLMAAVIPSLAVNAPATEETSELNVLKEQLEQANDAFERAMQQHQSTVNAISRRIEALEAGQDAASPIAEQDHAPHDHNEDELLHHHGTDGHADHMQRDGVEASLEFELAGTFAAGGSTADDIAGGTEVGAHDPNQRGFTVQGIEALITGTVDPYFRGHVAVNFSVDAEGESFFELEEAWMESLSLPAGFKLRGGQIYSEFGLHNPTHLHTWDFVDTPLVNGLILGPDGLRNPGAFLSWVAPTSFHTELIIGLQDSQGETAASFRGETGHSHGGEAEAFLPYSYRHRDNDRGVATVSDLLVTPRLATSFALSDTVSMSLGVSGAFGPNNIGGEGGGDTRTEVYGADLAIEWKPANQQEGSRFVRWQTEAMLRKAAVGAFDWDEDGDGVVSPGEIEDLNTGLPAVLTGERLTDYGLYTQLVYGFHRGWTTGLRFGWFYGEEADYEKRNLALDGEVLGPDLLRNARWRVSPNITWHPTGFSKVRLQYNYDDRRDIGIDHSLWLQFEFILGAHTDHTF